ncbi:MAG: hypothetical protein DRP45_10555 [Candidatus Zixiibacteriota bacterium]|nr:MAG: hypothetical protein DRP45_10555 [candidate division Zixibacteria bacterium]
MKYYRIAVAVIVGVITLSALALAGRTEHVSEVIFAEEAERLEVTIDFGAGELEISTADMEEAARLDIDYTPRRVAYDTEYFKRGKTGRLFLESKHRGDDWDDDTDNEWELVLSTRYEMILELDIGACETRMDLGGIPLTEVDIDMGASSGIIEFSEPNPVRLETFDIDVGASSLEIDGLANANVERITFSCGAASCDLDFRGDFRGETELDIDVGVGSADIVVPRGLAVRVECNGGFFSSVDFHGVKLREVDDDIWETADFEDADDRILIRADVGLGSVDIRAKR